MHFIIINLYNKFFIKYVFIINFMYKLPTGFIIAQLLRINFVNFIFYIIQVFQCINIFSTSYGFTIVMFEFLTVKIEINIKMYNSVSYVTYRETIQ